MKRLLKFGAVALAAAFTGLAAQAQEVTRCAASLGLQAGEG